MDILFSKYDLTQTLGNQTQRLREHINKLDENYIPGASEDDLVAYLKQEFSLDPIVLGDPFMRSREKPTSTSVMILSDAVLSGI